MFLDAIVQLSIPHPSFIFAQCRSHLNSSTCGQASFISFMYEKAIPEMAIRSAMMTIKVQAKLRVDRC